MIEDEVFTTSADLAIALKNRNAELVELQLIGYPSYSQVERAVQAVSDAGGRFNMIGTIFQNKGEMGDKDLFDFFELNNFSHCAEHSFPAASFGNQIDAYKGERFLIRIVTDRGQKFLDLAQDGTDWKSVFSFATAVDKQFTAKRGSYSEAVKTLIEYWPKIGANGSSV